MHGRLAPVFDLYGEQSESGKYKCEISFSNRKFGIFHHLSPYRKSFGNFVQKTALDFVVDRVRPIGVSPWFSATTRRLFGRVCRRKPLHRIGNSPLASAPAARRSTARDTTAPHRTTEPRSAPHAEPPGRDPTAPVPSRRSSVQVKKMFALRQQTALLAGASVTGPRGSTAARARSTARRPVRVSAVATEQIGKVRFIPPRPPTVDAPRLIIRTHSG